MHKTMMSLTICLSIILMFICRQAIAVDINSNDILRIPLKLSSLIQSDYTRIIKQRERSDIYDATEVYVAESQFLICTLLRSVMQDIGETEKLSIIRLDLDDFGTVCRDYAKAMITDTNLKGEELVEKTQYYKAEIGDRVTDDVGLVILANTLPGEIACQYTTNWDSYMIILPNCSLKEALIRAERIRKQIEDYCYSDWHKSKIGHKVVPRGRIRASFGVAEYSGNERSTSLAYRADKALARSKNTGKNRTHAFEDGEIKEIILYRDISREWL